MATGKNNQRGNRFQKVPVNPERIAQGKKETPQEILKRGSQGNPSQKDWVALLEKQKQRVASEKPNLDSKVAERKQQLEKEKSMNQNKVQQKTKEHDKNR
jgi:hypothetical protein